MKKQSKWLLVGSLMCIGVGSVFQSSYGMKRNLVDNEQQSKKKQKTEGMDLPDEMILSIMTFLTPGDIVKFGETCKKINLISNEGYLWKQKAVEAGASEVELKKVKKEFFRYKDIFIGYKHWNEFNKIKDAFNVMNEENLELLMQSAENGEDAIDCLLRAYQDGRYGRQANDRKCLELLMQSAENGSEKAINHLLYAYLNSWYGLQANDPEGLVLAKEYVKKGSQVAIRYLLDAYHVGLYGLNQNHPEGLKLAIKYAKEGSKVAIDHFLKAYKRDWPGDQKYDSEVFKLVTRLAIDGNAMALRIFNEYKDDVKLNFKRNDKQMPFSDVSFSFN